jgi:hypothetical protein
MGAFDGARRRAILGNSLVLVGTGPGAVPDPAAMVPVEGASGQQY